MSNVRGNVVIAAFALGILTGEVGAQTLEEVKVEAFRSVGTKAGGRSLSGVPILDLSLSYGVSLEGLDLSTSSGARQAEDRLNRAAQAACRGIGRQYPDATPDEKECAKTASDKALVTLHELVAAAEKARK